MFGKLDGIKGYDGVVKTIADQVDMKTRVRPSYKQATSLFGRSGYDGVVKAIADQVEMKTGVRASDEVAASLFGLHCFIHNN